MSTMHYDITIEGHLDCSHWARWFKGMAIVLTDDGNTTISGQVTDQAALHGLLAKIRDLGLPLVALQREPHPQPPLRTSEREGKLHTPSSNLRE